jgi:hypothetical protein
VRILFEDADLDPQARLVVDATDPFSAVHNPPIEQYISDILNPLRDSDVEPGNSEGTQFNTVRLLC